MAYAKTYAVNPCLSIIICGLVTNPYMEVVGVRLSWEKPIVLTTTIQATDLAGYRNRPVYIRKSMHTPPNYAAVRDLMPAFFELLGNEENPAVRVVLGHFIFVYIHPYIDGNGRMGRFLMNTMLAAGGYSWIIIPVERRNEYYECARTR